MADLEEQPIVCERSLKHVSAGGETILIVRVRSPFRLQHDANGAHRCDFEIAGLPEALFKRGIGLSKAERPPGHDIDGLPKTMALHALGFDGMQALEIALSGIYYHLKPLRDELFYLDDAPYDDLAVYISVEDAGRKRRIEEILDEEQYATRMRVQKLKRLREAISKRGMFGPG